MTNKEKKNNASAKKLLLEVRNFLTEQRNKASQEEQQAFNENIKKILFCVFDLMTVER